MTVLKLKEAQLAVILKHNPMLDDYHRGIRQVSDIKTFDEVVNDDESFVYGDFSQQDALHALKLGKVTVYSSKAINLGDFVSTSHRMAQDYAGHSGRVNQRTVNLTEVAWLDGDEGVYTGPIKLKEEKKMSIKIESKVVLSEKLKANLTKLASKYYPEGDIVVHGPIRTGLLIANYHPTPQEYATLSIQVVGDEIVGIGKRFGEETDPKIKAFKDAFNEAKKRVAAKQPTPAKPVQAPVQPVQAPAKTVAPAPAQQASTSIPKNYRRIDGSKRKLYFVEGQFYPPYSSVIVAIGDSPQNSEVYTEDGQKLYLGVKRYKLLKQGTRAGLQVTPINPNNGGSKMALAYFKIELV